VTQSDRQCDNVTHYGEGTKVLCKNSALGEGTSIYVKTAKCIGGLLLGA